METQGTFFVAKEKATDLSWSYDFTGSKLVSKDYELLIQEYTDPEVIKKRKSSLWLILVKPSWLIKWVFSSLYKKKWNSFVFDMKQGNFRKQYLLFIDNKKNKALIKKYSLLE